MPREISTSPYSHKNIETFLPYADSFLITFIPGTEIFPTVMSKRMVSALPCVLESSQLQQHLSIVLPAVQ